MTTVRTAVSWAEQVWGRSIEDVHRLSGGWTSTMLGLTAHQGDRAVLRLMTKEPWRSHAAELLARESRTQRQLADTAITAPRTLALDLEGPDAGAPAHLMSWLPSSLELTRKDDGFLRVLAQLLHQIHSFEPGPTRPRDYQSWATPAKRVVPEWSQCPGLWTESFAILEQPPPPCRGSFLNRDFHVGNILWIDDEVSGVVDWVETSWGPTRLDAAHAATYLAMLHGTETADRFSLIHDSLRGRRRARR